MRVDNGTALECAKILKEFCDGRGCNDCPINCRWDVNNHRIPTQIPAKWNLPERLEEAKNEEGTK